MKVNKKEKASIEKALKYWEKQELLESEKRKQLDESLELQPFNWNSVALYSFIFASGSILIAVVSIFADEALIKFFDSILSGSYLLKSGFFLFLSLALFFIDYKKNSNSRNYSKQLYGLIAAISLAISVGLFAFYLGLEEHSGFLILLLSISYASITLVQKRLLFWYFALAALFIGFGLETYFWSNEEELLLGMNFFMRYSLFTLVLIPLIELLKKSKKLSFTYESTQSIVLTVFLFSLWVLSITGNFTSYDDWLAVSQYELWIYAILLLLASATAIYVGIKNEDTLVKNLGVTFLFINIYTRYFEYFWEDMHKAIFFAFLGLSFWLIGRKAEKLWKKMA